MSTVRNIVFVVILGAVIAAGCQGCPGCAPPESPGELVRSDAPRDESPRVERDTHRAHRDAEHDLAFDLFHSLATDDDTDNVVFSPYAAASMLAKLYAGAGGDTRTEIAESFGFQFDGDAVHAVYNELDRQFERQARHGDVVFRVINALIVDEAMALSDDYLDLLAIHYGTGIHVLDFGDEPEHSRQSVNQWLAAHTNNRFPAHLPQGALADTDGLALASTIYFQARWQYRFDPAHTTPMTFRAYDGTDTDVDMMRGEQAYRFFRDGKTRAAAIGFDGANVSFLAIKPATEEQDFDEWAAELDGSYFRDVVDGLGGLTKGEVTLPKVTFEARTDLEGALGGLGLTSPFDVDSADFSSLHNGDNLYVAQAAQEAVIDLDEHGGHDDFEQLEHRAGAREQTMHFDRPFFFAVYDQATDTILLLGRFVQP